MLNDLIYFSLLFLVIAVPFYFRHRVLTLGISEQTIARIHSINSKLTVFIIISLFTLGFIGIQLKSTTFQEASFFSCLFSFFLLHTFHQKTVGEFKNVPTDSPKEQFHRSFRKFCIFILYFGMYLITTELLIPYIGTLCSIIIALSLLVYSVPAVIRFSLSASPMYPSSFKEEIKAVFQSAGTNIREVYLIEYPQARACNAFVCGSRFGFGPFRRSLFVTKNIFEVLEPEEIKAVISHEAAHFRLNHIFKRMMVAIGVLFLSIIAISFPLVFIVTLINPGPGIKLATVMISTLLTVYAQFYFLFKAIRKQEFEADLEAVKIGCKPQTLIRTLLKIATHNHADRKKPGGFSRFVYFDGHPGIDERVEAIEKNKSPSDANVLPSWQVGISYATLMILITTLAVTYQSQDSIKHETGRTIASEKKSEPEARQLLPSQKKSIKSTQGKVEQ